MGCMMQAGKQRKETGTRLGLWGEVERWVPGKGYLAYIYLYSGFGFFSGHARGLTVMGRWGDGTYRKKY